MRFALLGSLTVLDDAGAALAPVGGRQRSLLACLLVRANNPVSYDALIDVVWDGRRLSGSETTVRSVVMRLRQGLGPELAARVVAHAPGYLVRVGEAELDSLRFEALCRDAGAAVRAGAWENAARAAAEALGLWRGEPLVDVPSETLRAQVVPRLAELRLQALEDGAQAGLHLGQHEQLVPRVRALAAEHPLRERFHLQLMLALARSGRRAEALAAYRNARRVLVDELATEPGPELRDLHERILTGDVDLPGPPAAATAAATPTAPPAPTVSSAPAIPAQPPRPEGVSRSAQPHDAPRQLPAGMRHFVGRTGELKTLSGLLAQETPPGGAVVISAIGGTAGIGKTALALHWAHQAAERFPDGQLYVNLRGFDPSGTPMAPADAVRGFLDALGVPAQRIPADPDAQAAFYRTRLADRRMLIVLDNARDAEQVRPLLPGTPGCLVLVTSRDQLAELVALHGAVPMTLDLLSPDEARELLVGRLGGERLAADERAAEELIRACARLPLALNIAAAHAALHPARPLSQIVDGLRDSRRRLDTLTIGDGAADVRAVFSWSYRTLAPETARVFRLLGVHPGPDVSTEAAAALAALDPDAARRALDELTRAHLLTEHVPGRYSFHDLLRAYASEQAHAESEAERRDALWRVCDFYLRTAHIAERLLDPHRPLIPPAAPTTDARPRQLADMPAALAWFDAEHPNLLAAQHTAAGHGWHATAWHLAWNLTTFHHRRAHHLDQLAVWRTAVDAAVHLPDPSARIGAHRAVGVAYGDLGRHEEAIEHLHHCLALAEHHRELGDQALAHRALAWTWEKHEDFQRALRHSTLALDLLRTLGQPSQEANVLNGMGWTAACAGEFDAARAHCQAAVALYTSRQNLYGEATALGNLGYIAHHTGDYAQALDYYRHSLALLREVGDNFHEAMALDWTGQTHSSIGDRDQALAAWRQAVDLYQQQGRIQEAERVQGQIDALDEHPQPSSAALNQRFTGPA